ncbi:uncharacterized protein LOC135701797 [Ochlerotatus camptorhynchus]|uniref:uncharacterized protein LOC135701797 n=1 Tax=Ochlerotatus camptorhynchus TaxID=644619 RepID=UPI0031E2FDB2
MMKRARIHIYKVWKAPNRNDIQNTVAKTCAWKLYRVWLTKRRYVVIDDETYIKADTKQLLGQESYVATSRLAVPEEVRKKKVAKFSRKFFVWQATCGCGKISLPDITMDTINDKSTGTTLPDEGELTEAPLEDCWSNVKAAINSAVEGAAGFVERNRRNDWFDKECQTVLDEKNTARAAMLQQGTRHNVERYKQKRRQQTHLFRYKKRHLEELESEEMEQLYRSQEIRKIYKKLNASRQGFVVRAEMSRDKEGGILTDEREVIERWKQHYDEHLNGTKAEDQGGRRNGFVGTVDVGDMPAPMIGEVKDAIR